PAAAARRAAVPGHSRGRWYRSPVQDLTADPGGVEAVRAQDLVVAAALRHLRHADLLDARRRLRSLVGERGKHGVALAPGDVVVVERDDLSATGDLCEPRAVDVAEPRERNEARLDPVLGEQVGRVPPRGD